MNQPTPKHKEEAREIAEIQGRAGTKYQSTRLGDPLEEPCPGCGCVTFAAARKDVNTLLVILSSRDTEIREVLEGLASKHYVSLGEYCWCRAPGTATKPAGDYHGDACLAARGLWERVQVDVKKEESNVAE